MDTEGVEHLIIKGGQQILKKATLVVIECTFIEAHKNQSSFSILYEEMSRLGFIYKGSMLDSFFYPTFGPKIYENSLFIKKAELPNYLKMW